jgi:hypothetical protein
MRPELLRFSRNSPIMPSWFPWIVVGGLAFMLLSFLASKYNGKAHAPRAFAQDFLSGGIVVTLLGILAPDVFPTFPLSVPSSGEVSSTMKGLLSGGGGEDMDLQIGPLGR